MSTRVSACPFRAHIIPSSKTVTTKKKNTTFQDRGETTGQGDVVASKEQRHFSPLAAILENRRVTLFH
jgi:hypothetical protein